MELTEYTFTFGYDQERKFNGVLSRLSEDEYNILNPIHPVEVKEHEDVRYVDRETTIEMEAEAALTFRLAMGNNIKIRRKRTEEELAEEKELNDRHTIRINVQIPMGNPEEK